MCISKEEKRKKEEFTSMMTFDFHKNSKLKTGLVVLLLISLVFTSGTVFSHAATSSSTAASSVTMLLASMGVISADSNGEYNLSKTVTRAEFAKMLIMASGYKDLVNTTSSSSLYKDVLAKYWAAPYIKIAVSNGLMSGYSDRTFRPDSTVTLEQAVNSVLILLGYTAEDFTGAFPAAQMNIYYSNGLSANISGGIGTLLTKGDVANLLYNMLGTTVEDGSQTYAESIGYTLNESGEVDYAQIVSDNMTGPYTVESSYWAYELGMDTSSLTIYKNGNLIEASDVNPYDILYYSQSKDTVWVYDDKVTGVYEDATPSQNAVTSVTVSGTTYSIESTAAFAALSSSGTLKIGTAVTLLLGKDGGVADAVSATAVNDDIIVYVTETGTKTYTNSKGKEYTSDYFAGIRPNGTSIEYTTDEGWIEPGDLVKVSFDSDGDMSVSTTSNGGGITGIADASLYTIGTTSIATTATILDANLGNYCKTSMSRLDGVKFTSGDVLYYEATGGKVTMIILDDVTGDTSQYGVVTSAHSSSGSSSESGTYKYMLDGITTTLKTSDYSLGVGGGAAEFYGESGEITHIKNLYQAGTKVLKFSSTTLTVNDDIGTYPISADVAVFHLSSGTYKASTLTDAISAWNSNKTVKFYYDEKPINGGQIRVIIYQ